MVDCNEYIRLDFSFKYHFIICLGLFIITCDECAQAASAAANIIVIHSLASHFVQFVFICVFHFSQQNKNKTESSDALVLSSPFNFNLNMKGI